MLTDKDYSKMTLDELVSEEKKMNSQKTLTAALIGLFVGVAFWSAIDRNFVLTVGMLIFAFLISSSYNKKRKSIQAEISRRNTIG